MARRSVCWKTRTIHDGRGGEKKPPPRRDVRGNLGSCVGIQSYMYYYYYYYCVFVSLHRSPPAFSVTAPGHYSGKIIKYFVCIGVAGRSGHLLEREGKNLYFIPTVFGNEADNHCAHNERPECTRIPLEYEYTTITLNNVCIYYTREIHTVPYNHGGSQKIGFLKGPFAKLLCPR